MPDLADIITDYFERGCRFRRIEADDAIHTQSPKAFAIRHFVKAILENKLGKRYRDA